jgi:hypothetical protein
VRGRNLDREGDVIGAKTLDQHIVGAALLHLVAQVYLLAANAVTGRATNLSKVQLVRTVHQGHLQAVAWGHGLHSTGETNCHIYWSRLQAECVPPVEARAFTCKPSHTACEIDFLTFEGSPMRMGKCGAGLDEQCEAHQESQSTPSKHVYLRRKVASL